MIEELLKALRATPAAQLEEFKAFCGREYQRGGFPGAMVWWALAGVVGEVLDDAQAEVDQLERGFDDEGGVGEQLPGV